MQERSTRHESNVQTVAGHVRASDMEDTDACDLMNIDASDLRDTSRVRGGMSGSEAVGACYLTMPRCLHRWDWWEEHLCFYCLQGHCRVLLQLLLLLVVLLQRLG